MRTRSLSFILALILGCSRAGTSEPPPGGVAPEETVSAEAPPSLPAALPRARRVPIQVRRSGYVPSSLAAKADEALVLIFTRSEETECGRFITVRGTDVRAELPLHVPVEVPVTMPHQGELVFACGMDMMHGIVTVTPD